MAGSARRDRNVDIAWSLAAITFIFHVIANPHYGFFRDELYFIICGRHPDFGYVDQPSLVPLLAAGSQIFGASLILLRAVSAFFSAATVWVGCRVAREIGGGAFAQALAGAAILLGTADSALSTDSPGMWLWPLIGLLVIRIVKGASPMLWVWVGAATGVAINAKYSVAFFIVALLAGLLLTSERRLLANRWFAAGSATALALALPNFLWQSAHGFPMIELLKNGAAGKNVVVGPLEYVVREILLDNPVLAMIWLSGLVFAFLRAPMRWLGLTYAVLIAMMIALHAKDYYPQAIYPLLFAIGGVAIESWTTRRLGVRPAIVAVAVVTGALTVPTSVPLLPEPVFTSYAQALDLVAQPEENKTMGALPQYYADMHGWPELVKSAAEVYDALPPARRARTAIFATNYGEAAAIDFFGAQYGLPPAVCAHNQYYLWGTHGFDGDPAVVMNVKASEFKRMQVYRVTEFRNRLGMPYEDHMPIIVVGGAPWIRQDWPVLKHFD